MSVRCIHVYHSHELDGWFEYNVFAWTVCIDDWTVDIGFMARMSFIGRCVGYEVGACTSRCSFDNAEGAEAVDGDCLAAMEGVTHNVQDCLDDFEAKRWITITTIGDIEDFVDCFGEVVDGGGVWFGRLHTLYGFPGVSPRIFSPFSLRALLRSVLLSKRRGEPSGQHTPCLAS